MSAPETLPLAGFQRAFAHALLAVDPLDDCPPQLRALFAQPGFAVYRNTVTKGCVDALRANYPAVAMLVGEEWFAAAATIHARAEPPRSPVLLEYGAGFADFLAAFPPAADMRWLADVARLDRFWTEAHMAADRSPLQPSRVAALDAEQLGSAVLSPHPSARWAWFDEAPVAAMWRRNRAASDAASDAAADATSDATSDAAERAAACGAASAAVEVDLSDLEWTGDGLLLVRPRDRVEAVDVDRAACAFLDACAAGRTLSVAATAAIEADPAVDLGRLMAALLACGAFGDMESMNHAGAQT